MMELGPASTVILKLTECCNIVCTYCYVFEFDKEISGQRPFFFRREILDCTLDRLAEHFVASGRCGVFISLHGGEPLLLGKSRFRDYVQTIRKRLEMFDVVMGTQTNGLLIDDEWLDLFSEEDVHFSVSLDGPLSTYDKYRLRKA